MVPDEYDDSNDWLQELIDYNRQAILIAFSDEMWIF